MTTLSAEIAWWRRTGVFPILHLLMVRRSLVEAGPDLPQRLFVAFDRAHRADPRRGAVQVRTAP